MKKLVKPSTFPPFYEKNDNSYPRARIIIPFPRVGIKIPIDLCTYILVMELEIPHGLGEWESNSSPKGRSKKNSSPRPKAAGRNFFDLPEGEEFDSHSPNP